MDFDQSLNKAVGRLIEALGDNAEKPRVVETLPRKGYRFIATVEQTQQELACSTSGLGPNERKESGRSVERHSKGTESAVTVAATTEVPTRKSWGGLGVGLVVIGVITWGAYAYFVPRSEPIQRIEITQVTGSGKVKIAAISLDGRHVGYVVDEGASR